MSDSVVVSAVASAAAISCTWLFCRTLRTLNFVVATSSQPEAAAVSEEELSELDEVDERFPTELGRDQMTYEGAAEMLDSQL